MEWGSDGSTGEDSEKGWWEKKPTGGSTERHAFRARGGWRDPVDYPGPRLEMDSIYVKTSVA